jgi:hypothetical protein
VLINNSHFKLKGLSQFSDIGRADTNITVGFLFLIHALLNFEKGESKINLLSLFFYQGKCSREIIYI